LRERKKLIESGQRERVKERKREREVIIGEIFTSTLAQLKRVIKPKSHIYNTNGNPPKKANSNNLL
jgi:hypothetical protein